MPVKNVSLCLQPHCGEEMMIYCGNWLFEENNPNKYLHRILKREIIVIAKVQLGVEDGRVCISYWPDFQG